MEDFNSFINNTDKSSKKTTQENSNKSNQNLTGLIQSLATKYNGASELELLQAIFKEAEKGKRNGTLTNNDIDNFAKTLSPLLDEKKRARLQKIVNDLKNK